MVFESVLAGVLNNVLGDFVDNLDPSQLNVGIWGGDVKLKDLELKESALNASGLPLRLKFGRLKSLIMKIPWNKLYTEPVIVDVEGLYVVITPNRSIVYDEEKALQTESTAKQKKLNALEENRRAKRKNKSDVEDLQQSSSFTEKLVAQIIKNLQVTIKNIHIRYEDKFSNHDRPFSFGITLESLVFQTTNTKFEPIIPKEDTKMFYKLVSLNNLAVYGNYQSKIFSDSESKEDVFTILRSTIATKYAKPEDYRYMFGPISINAKLILNQTPELMKFKMPKVDLTIETDEIGFAIDKFHYQDMFLLLEALDQFNVGQPYLKFRPYLTEYRGHYKEWYKFAYESVLEDIRRRRRMWSWESIKQHRKLVKDYRDAWIHIRTEKKPHAPHKALVEKTEFELDVFNLNMAREQAEMDIDRLGLIRVEDQAAETWGSWAKGLVGWKANPENEIVTKFHDAMTPEEKNKLYAAIDFQENLPPTNYPKDFVENKFSLKVSKVSLIIDQRLHLSVTDLQTEFMQRPSARGIHLKSSVKSVSMHGFEEQILHTGVSDENWLDAEFITNPLDNTFDYYFGLNTAPVTFKYHAPIASTLVDVFQQPRSIEIARDMTSASFEAMKARSQTGLTYAISKNARLKLNISFAPFIVVITKGGEYNESVPTLIGKSGSLSIITVDDIGKFKIGSNMNSQINEEVMSKAYQKIHCSMSDIQLCFADNYRTCVSALTDETSSNHLIKPIGIDLIFCKAVIEDSQIPGYHVFCELPKLCANISDDRLTKLLELLLAFPKPTPSIDDNESIDIEEGVTRISVRPDARTKSSATDESSVSPDQSDGSKHTLESNSSHLCVFEFKIGEISLLLYSHKFQKVESLGEFCALNFTDIGLNGHMTRDGYTQFRLKLQTLMMEDMREGIFIKRLLEKKNGPNTASDNPFAELFYEQGPGGVKRMNLTSSSFYVLLNPEFLGALSCFVVMPKKNESDTGLHPELATNNNVRLPNKSFNSAGGNDIPAVKIDRDTPSGSLTMKCRIKQVEVILIEDSSRPKESQALILSLNAYLDSKNENDIQHFDGSIQDLQITSTYFDVNKRVDFAYSVLRKVDIVLKGTINEADKAHDFNINMDKFHVKVSPSVIRLLSIVSTNFTKHQNAQEADETDESGKRVLKAYPNYWQPQKIRKRDYWWFQSAAEEAQEIGTLQQTGGAVKTSSYSEKAKFCINSFMITVEAGLENVTVPMILLDSNLSTTARNWSSLLELDAEMSLQMKYYNEAFCVWEPIIEPVKVKGKNNRKVWKSWKLEFKVRSHEDQFVTVTELDGKEREIQLPKMIVTINAKEMMNVTVTKSFLQLTSNLTIAFNEAARQIMPPKTRSLPGNSSYLILNETGINVEISNSETLKVSDSDVKVKLPHSKFFELEPVEGEKEDVASARGVLLTEENYRKSELRLHLLGAEREVNVMRAEKRCITLPKEADSIRQWIMMVDTRLENSRHIVYLRSLINFVNHTPTDIEVYACDTKENNRMTMCGYAKTDEEPLYIPLKCVYTPTGDFNFTIDNHESSNDSVSWHDFDAKNRFRFRCNCSDSAKRGSFVEGVVETEYVCDEKGKHNAYKLYTVHLYPPLFLRNYLPIPLTVQNPIEKTLNSGEGTALNLIAGLYLEFSVAYNEKTYSAKMEISETKPDLSTIVLHNKDDTNDSLLVGLNWSTQNRQLELNVFVRHWMVNNTNKILLYADIQTPRLQQICFCSFCFRKVPADLSQNTGVVHDVGRNPVFFPLSAKNFYDNKKAKVCIRNKTEYSNDFPLDTAGNAGRIICQDKNGRAYEFSVDVQICHFGLTKVITFSPFYLVQNDSYFDIEIREKDSNEWLVIPQKSCVDLWPSQSNNRKFMQVRFKGQPEESILFPFTETFESFCKINNPYLGVYVTCIVGESSSVIRIEPFVPGMVPAIVMNATPYRIRYRQSSNNESSENVGEEEIIESGQLKAFTWSDVTIHDRTFRWKSGDHEAQNHLLRNDAGDYLPSKRDKYFHWVSFLNGRQRIFLFTKDERVAFKALQSYEMERINIQTELNLYGIGLSLVNNLEGIEVLYMAMSSSDILWEQESKSRYRPLSMREIAECEMAYDKWKDSGSSIGFHSVDNFEIDFTSMKMRAKGKKKEVKIRRSFQNGLWVQMRQSSHQTQVHVKLNHLQVDNQLPACVFPCVLAVVPPPKSVVANNEPKPFTELSFVMSQSEYSNIVEIKYLHILVQEFAIRIDNGLINAAIDFFSSETTTFQKLTFERDLELIAPQLSQRALHTTATQVKSYYYDLHISPLMVHLSFSQGGSLDKKKDEDGGGLKIHSEFLNVILKSFGVTVTELQDVVFKLAYFDRKYAFYNRNELTLEVMSHYKFQFIKQFYVLVLGLDIIGNPYGLVKDLSAGVEDFFYQPFQGLILGPEEFVEGLALGVSSLVGHAFGGAAGAVSRIAGTLGKGVAALTLDDEYQRKRQEQLNRRPQNIGEGLSRSARGVGQGVYDGVTGVFFKPIEGAREGGVSGFALGFGKGIVGAVARPISGVVDFASGTLDIIKNVATSFDESKSIRPPRVILKDYIIRPFSYDDAIGYKIFRDTDHGMYSKTDQYICHHFIDRKHIVIVTDQRVLFSKQQDILGGWTTEWAHLYSDIERPRLAVKQPLAIDLRLKKRSRGLLGLTSRSNGNAIKFESAEIVQNILAKMQAAYEKSV